MSIIDIKYCKYTFGIFFEIFAPDIEPKMEPIPINNPNKKFTKSNKLFAMVL